jgi:glyoxylase-like metal-dependent hydrolase (beta-lactamase superfamily II)
MPVRYTSLVCVLMALFRGLALASPPAGIETAPPVSSIAPGVYVISGTFPEGRQPDGNSVIFSAPDGLIVMDTGRHAQHVQQILDFASRAGRPVVAIINSHWHLDHIGGNSRIRSAFPNAHIYASTALRGALQGFLADYQRDLEGAIKQMPDDPQVPQWRDELAIIADAPRSLADEPIESSGIRVIGGRELNVHLEKNAVTAGDVWLLDSTTHVLASGDLVTLPVPFFDTACPEGWKSALDNISHASFKVLVPGHGAPMRRAAFETYRRAYGNLLTCTAAPENADLTCVDGWVHDAGKLIADVDGKRVRKMMGYYVTNSLRAKAEHIAGLCGAQAQG